MMTNKLLWAALSVVIGSLQALDSGVLRAGTQVVLLAAAGVAIPSAALAATSKWGVWVASLILGAALLAAARAISPVSLNALHIGLLVPAMYVFVVCGLEKKIAA